MLHDKFVQGIGAFIFLILAWYVYEIKRAKKVNEADLYKPITPRELIDMREGTEASKGIVPNDLAEEYQTMWNVPEWKLGGYEESSKRIWEKIDKGIPAEEN